MSKKTLYFDCHSGYDFSAVAEAGKIIQFSFEAKKRHSIIGNIYKGKIESVLTGIQSAFINCGLERNCYLSAEDLVPDESKYEGENGEIPALSSLKEGDEIFVQVIKAPVGNKGARVKAYPHFVGKHIIYMPNTPFIGVSRKIGDEELRKNLIYSAREMIAGDEGLILRTAAPYARRETLEQELNYFRKLYSEVENAFKSAKTGDLLYTDLELPMRVMRDSLDYEIEKIIVGTEKLKDLITKLVNLNPPSLRPPVILHDSGRDMAEQHGLLTQIEESLSPRVNLNNGAYLIIERTEALTVIDVNTGSFVGSDSLEQTVYHTNIMAAREIARQVRLRNIGGIVVVDFIDMYSDTHKKALVDELERALSKDSVKCSVSPMSRLGLVEFTRKRAGGNTLTAITRPCRHCKKGYTKSPAFMLMQLRAKLMEMYADGQRSFRIDMNYGLLNELNGSVDLLNDLQARLKNAELYCVPRKSYSEEQLTYSAELNPLPANAVKIF